MESSAQVLKDSFSSRCSIGRRSADDSTSMRGWKIDVSGFHLDCQRTEESSVFHQATAPSSSLNSSARFSSAENTRNANPKSPAASKRILWKRLCLLKTLCKKIRDLRLTSSKTTKRCTDSSSIEWCRSNADISINDAILHCKKSYGK
ncbi:putative membrane-associated kinase regulator 6 [Canna indica]|uniref:Membrane-associated kinase regulator 6 n=1 Tax=Canna indica TaxID=4628 RepID=A0AAQ3K2M6_9LILI|nr:putative membrane-associated kinase regulator 6 [Canna indica]